MAQQHGVVTRSQLLAAGLTARMIEWRLERGRLHAIHHGVYAVGYLSGSPLQRAMAAVLACGGVLSHRSAAALWEIGPTWRGPVDVTAPTRRQHDGIVVRRSCLGRDEMTVRRGIPVTTVPRTLLDLASVADHRELRRAVNEARVVRLIRRYELEAKPGKQGAGHLRRLLEPLDAPTRSALEDRCLALIERHRLPRPEVNRRVAGYEVDMLWREQRLVVELDGRRFHDHPDAFERDRRKDARLVAAGYRVIRITWNRLVTDPKGEAQRLRSLLEPRP